MNRLKHLPEASRVVFVFALFWLLQACGSSRRSEPIRGPLALETEKLEQGKVVFVEHCHKCHPGGETGLGPALNNKPVPGVMLRLQIRKGLGAMPGFGRELISSAEMDQLVAYLKALRRN
jgi:mono/diheme cytochrome c family protein